MKATAEELESELRRLIDMRPRSDGVDLKRTNHRIAQLQNRIDNMKANEAI